MSWFQRADDDAPDSATAAAASSSSAAAAQQPLVGQSASRQTSGVPRRTRTTSAKHVPAVAHGPSSQLSPPSYIPMPSPYTRSTFSFEGHSLFGPTTENVLGSSLRNRRSRQASERSVIAGSVPRRSSGLTMSPSASKGVRFMPANDESGASDSANSGAEEEEEDDDDQRPLLAAAQRKAQMNNGARSTGGNGGGGGRDGTEAEGGSFEKAPLPETLAKRISNSFLIGVINVIILIPSMVAYAQIIFSAPFYKPYLDTLVKLVLFSSVVHQSCLTLLSSLPFAIGQVQDAGLIFLSSMATKIAKQLLDEGHPAEDIFATTLVWLSLATALLGVALWITGKLKLASMVQYLPMPVVGGYLSYIGLYCLQAGLSLMADEPLNSVVDWGKLAHRDIIILLTPGLLLGVVMLLVSRKIRHFLALPATLLLIPAIFYAVVYAAGYTLDDARNAFNGKGWIGQAANGVDFRETWNGFKFDRVHWHVIPNLLPTWLAMYFVVAFSSCLDVAAIQMELGRPLDFNHELKTVGISNILSGLTGGQTGSYIFSQTIFTMRTGIRSRLQALFIILFSMIVFGMPVSLMAYIPKAFFGGVLAYIAYDLMLDWLVASYKLVSHVEYLIVWGTLIAITALNNLEFGFLIGIGLCLVAFIFQYSRQPTGVKVRKRSNVIRGYKQRQILAKEHKGIVCMELSGYIFFGRAVGLLKEVERNIVVYTDAASALPRSLSSINLIRNMNGEDSLKFVGDSQLSTGSLGNAQLVHDDGSESDDGSEHDVTENSAYPAAVAINIGDPSDQAEVRPWSSYQAGQQQAGTMRSPTSTSDSSGSNDAAKRRRSTARHHGMVNPVLVHLSAVSEGQRAMDREAQLERRRLHATEYLVLDFHHVTGVDATAVRTCFLILRQKLAVHGVTLIFTGMTPSIAKLMRAQGVLTFEDEEFKLAIEEHRGVGSSAEVLASSPPFALLPTLDEGLEYCEDQLLMDLGVSHPRRSSIREPGIRGILAAYDIFTDEEGVHGGLGTDEEIEYYFDVRHFDAGECIFRKNDVADAVYFILEGDVLVEREVKPRAPPASAIAATGGALQPGRGWLAAAGNTLRRRSGTQTGREMQTLGVKGGAATSQLTRRRVRRYDGGGIFGELNFLLCQRRWFTAKCTSRTHLYVLTRSSLTRMQRDRPELALAVQAAMLKSMARIGADQFANTVTG